ncbi:hypothetical protein PR048_000469 [Dryococelus australis]|uniref:Carboxylic ester hydrolase n=1 Tax=Dryococelus australis TaxID=614101 RepID=A0ABQ9IEP9_9NEOP|nr:hypothetical protein PR048_000469 [Dryococelus australis]
MDYNLRCQVTCSVQAGDSTVTVRTEDGLLRGKVATSIWNRTYHSFQAIPYAQPPVGDLRFKTPQPVKPWTGVRDALRQGTYCPQGIMNYTTANVSEDCLYLNVYVPQGASPTKQTKGRSVLVWIHGGGFVYGSGIRDLYGPDNLMNHTAILVTLNYRLGALGYMSMEHPDVTSNAGMKDQVAALRWVKRNIAHFGGNPDDVTVFGESAGGMSVELLLLSPMTEGLFHRAISESGSAVNMGSNRNYNGTQGAVRLAEVLGHNATNADDLVNFPPVCECRGHRESPVSGHHRSVDFLSDIIEICSVFGKSSKQLTLLYVNTFFLIFIYKVFIFENIFRAFYLICHQDGSTAALSTSPTLDAKIQEGHEVFLADVPEKLLRAGKSHPVPYITGANSKEMKMVETGPRAAQSRNRLRRECKLMNAVDLSRNSCCRVVTFLLITTGGIGTHVYGDPFNCVEDCRVMQPTRLKEKT